MNLYNYIEEKVITEKVLKIDLDKKEIAIVRMVLKELSKLFYRDYTFFLNKENLIDRETIYNREFDLNDIRDFSIVCKSYCEIIKKILIEKYDIDCQIISPFNDKFRHIDILITTKSGKKYIINPLSDLIEMQVGLRTKDFASKEYYDNSYFECLNGINFLTKEELEEIDDKIDYKNGNMYLDDYFEILKKYFVSVEKEINTNKDGETNKEDVITKFKLRFICKHFNNRKYINGFVDLLMFSNTVINEMFSEQEQQKIKTYNFFVDKKDLKDEKLSKIFENDEERKRGEMIQFNDRIYIFSLDSTYLEYDAEQWKNTVIKNNIFIKPKFPVKLLKYLKSNGADRNIVHNNEFLRLFNKFEFDLISSGKNLEDIKNNNVVVKDGMILTKFGGDRKLYKIENGHLVIEDYSLNTKSIVFYEDEGRKISYDTMPILKEKQHIVTESEINKER